MYRASAVIWAIENKVVLAKEAVELRAVGFVGVGGLGATI